jgi:Acetyltransferase (GNAT) domain
VQTRELFESAGATSFFSSMPWFHTFAKYALDEGDHIRIYSLPRDNTAGAPQAALATVHKSAKTGFFGSRKLSSLSSYYTSLFNMVSNGADDRKSARELAELIATEAPGWDEVDLRPLDVDAPVFSALVEGLETAGFVVQTYFCFGNWYSFVNGRSFAEYLEGLPSVLKNTLARKKKKLEKTGRAKIEIITAGGQLDAAIEAYNKVYLASWKQPEPYPNFVPELIRRCAELGALRLGLIHVDGEPAAAQFWIVQNGSALIYKLAYDERFADLSVGTILTAALMQYAIDVDRVAVVDYLTGDDSYKKDWMSFRRERWGILAMNPRTVRGAAAIARHVGGRAIKRFMNSIIKRAGKPERARRLA